MKKSTLIMILSLVLAIAVGAGSTLAYLSDTDADVNVMTLGNVDILQNEQERREDGSLDKFTQDKPLYPAVYEGDSIPWADAAEWPVPENEAWKVVAENENAVDKFVTVTNTGKSEAYVRTIIAYEGDPINGTDIHIVQNSNTSSNADVAAEFANVQYIENVVIDGVRYDVIVYTYAEALQPGETTIPSLKQIYMDKTCGNEEMEVYGDTYDVLVLSQAVQTAGFADAETALNEAFPMGDNNVNVPGWFTGWTEDDIGSPGKEWPNNNPPSDDVILVRTLDELIAALAEDSEIILMDDITLKNTVQIKNDVTLDMNGKTIRLEREDDFKSDSPLFHIFSDGKLTITGNGTIDLEENYDAALFQPDGELIIENGSFIKDRIPEGTPLAQMQLMFIGVKSEKSSVIIKDGYFDSGYYDANVEEFKETEDDVAKRGNSKDKNLFRNAAKMNCTMLLNLSSGQSFRVYGGTFVGVNPAWGDEGCALPITPEYLRPWSYYQGTFLEGQKMYDNKIELPAGYSITEGSISDGRPTYTVNYAN